MNTAVLYATMTGHSKKIATAISTQLGLPVHNINDNADLSTYDKVFIVSGIYSGESTPELTAFVSKLTCENVKSVVLVTSSATGVGAVKLRAQLVMCGIDVVEQEYLCRGSFLVMKMGHPNKSEIADAVEFVRENC